MRRRIAVIGVCGVLVALSVAAQPKPQPNIKGVWRVTEQTINERTLKGDQLGVGYHIYTDKYFAAVRESGTPPRPQVEDMTKATVGELNAMLGPFVTQLGTYEISGDRIVHLALVAKNPANQGNQPGAGQRLTLDGNTLVLEPIQRVPGNRQITLKMVRVE